MVEHVPAHAQLEEEEMVGPMNTPFVSPSQPTNKYLCDDIGNKKICISIITMYLYLYNMHGFCMGCISLVTSRPAIRRIKSMVCDRIPTQSKKERAQQLQREMTTD